MAASAGCYSFLILFFGSYCMASIHILDGPSANASTYCTSVSQFLGPQASQGTGTVVARLHVFYNDPCFAQNVHRYEVEGRAIFVESCACSEDRVYYNLASKGAAAVIRRTSFVPGSTYNIRSYNPEKSPRTSMMYVGVYPHALKPSEQYEGMLVSIEPDPNVWLLYFSSQRWQILLRWLPGSCYILGFVLSVFFVVKHFHDNMEKYYQQAPRSLQLRSEAIQYAVSRIDITHWALVIEIVKCPILAFVFLYGGYYSTPNLPDEVQRFFITQLSGITFMTTMISARVWYKATHRHSASESWLSRMIGDSASTHWFVMFTAIPFILDIIISVLYVMYVPNEYPVLDIVSGGIFFVLKLFVGSIFLMQASIFIIRVYRSSTAIDNYAANQDSTIKMALFNQTLYALAVGVSIAVSVSGSLIIVSSPEFFSQPQGYLTVFSLLSNAQAFETLFQIMIFRPVFKSGLQQLWTMSTQAIQRQRTTNTRALTTL